MAKRRSKAGSAQAAPSKRLRTLPNITAEQILQRGKPVKAPEIAASLGFSEATVYRGIRSGEIPSIRIGQQSGYRWNGIGEPTWRGWRPDERRNEKAPPRTANDAIPSRPARLLC